MGNVSFDTNVLKNVNITKTVNLTVDKTVLSAVQLTGNLATAEASADAIGGDPVPGPGGATKVEFTVDDFLDMDMITANALVGPNPAQSPAPVSVTTDIPGLERTLFTQVLSDEGSANLGVNNPLAGKLGFDQGDNTYSNAYADYQVAGGFDPFPGVENADILADFTANVDPTQFPDFGAVLEDVCYTYRFEDVDWDPGQGADQQAATLRVSLLVGDTSGNQALTTLLFVPGEDGTGFGGPEDDDGLTIYGSVAALIDETLGTPPGTFIAGDPTGGGVVTVGIEDDLDGNGFSIDFNAIDSFQILLEDDPTTAVGTNGFSSAGTTGFEVGVVDGALAALGLPGENPSVTGSDASVRNFVWTTCEDEGDYGLLAEVDTFAQVDDNGAFAFSESLAALDLLL